MSAKFINQTCNVFSVDRPQSILEDAQNKHLLMIDPEATDISYPVPDFTPRLATRIKAIYEFSYQHTFMSAFHTKCTHSSDVYGI